MDTRTDSEGGDGDEHEPEGGSRARTQADAGGPDRARRNAETNKILVDADRRDDEAAMRDSVSDERELAADRKAFLDPSGDYAGQSARRAAALDRADAKSDRESSAEDREQLAERASFEGQQGD